MNYRLVIKTLSMLLLLLCAFEVTVIIVSYLYAEYESMQAYVTSILINLMASLILYLVSKKNSQENFYRKEGIAIVALSWLFISLFGMIPFLLDNVFTNLFDAFFETASGFTTTGSSVLSNSEAVSKSSLYWRSLIQWLGGMGIIVLFIAIIPQLGVGAKQLFKSEVPGPITEGLKPKIKETSSLLWKIYIGLTILLICLLLVSGSDLFTAICHAFTTMATGGYSVFNNSISGYNSALIEYIIVVFMFIAGANFSLYYMFLKGKQFNLLKDIEFRVYFFMVLSFSLIIAIYIYPQKNSLEESFRFAIFQVVSIITTTGFATDDYLIYPLIPQFLILLLLFTGASAGSTAGGIKLSRIIIIIKNIYSEIVKSFKPNTILLVKFNRTVLKNDLIVGVSSFILLYLILLILGTFYLLAHNYDFQTSFSAVLTSLSNVGPGFGKVGPMYNFAFFENDVKFVLSILMIIGRLEIYSFIILFFPSYWKS